MTLAIQEVALIGTKLFVKIVLGDEHTWREIKPIAGDSEKAKEIQRLADSKEWFRPLPRESHSRLRR